MPNIGTESNISLIRFAEQAVTPDTPAATFSGLYMKANGLYVIDDAAAVTGPLTSNTVTDLATAKTALKKAARGIKSNRAAIDRIEQVLRNKLG